jgi:hypothetical protein
VASFSLAGRHVREVAPPAFEVQALVGADADAHVFEPRPADARRLAEADLVVVNGLGFEGWLDRLVKASGYRGTVVTASRDASRARAGGGADPHAWQDLAQARRYVATVAAALVERWPAEADSVRRRAADYDARLAALDADRSASGWTPLPATAPRHHGARCLRLFRRRLRRGLPVAPRLEHPQRAVGRRGGAPDPQIREQQVRACSSRTSATRG